MRGEDQGGAQEAMVGTAPAVTSWPPTSLCLPAEDAAHLELNARASSSKSQGIHRPFTRTCVSMCAGRLDGTVRALWLRHWLRDPQQGDGAGFTLATTSCGSIFGLKTDTADLLPLLEHVDKTLHTKLTYILSGSYKELGDTLEDVLEQSHLPKTFVVSESHCPRACTEHSSP